jgi:flavin reductase (DIM6/NTAB) family NADH-FMN oxidoreductase RutF/DNA-binding IclR family transcriptional regulator
VIPRQPEADTDQFGVDPKRFREVLGQYPTGVAVVTATSADGRPVGMTVGSFGSVSLDPPLVAFMPARTSSTWAAIRKVGRFCVNVLASTQEGVCRTLASKEPGKFDALAWRPSALGSPVLDGVVAYVDCEVADVHHAGDHDIVVGRVHRLEIIGHPSPLLFFQGGYGAFTPLSRASADADLMEQLRVVDLVRPHMDRLAEELDTECTAISLVGNELVLMAASGRAATTTAPTRVGQRVPFVPPLGSVFAAWGDEALKETWIAGLGDDASDAERARSRHVLQVIRARGYAVALGHADSERLEEASALISKRDARETGVNREQFDAALKRVRWQYNPDALDSRDIEFRYASAPVMSRSGDVVLTLTVWGPSRECDRATLERYADRLLAEAAAASSALEALPDT